MSRSAFWLGGGSRKQFHSRDACASEFCQSQVHEKPFARKATRVPSGAPGGAGVVGHATRTDVATRPRFGRGARHRTIRLREPPASGALRLPALHRGFVAEAAGPPRLKNHTRSIRWL